MHPALANALSLLLRVDPRTSRLPTRWPPARGHPTGSQPAKASPFATHRSCSRENRTTSIRDSRNDGSCTCRGSYQAHREWIVAKSSLDRRTLIQSLYYVLSQAPALASVAQLLHVWSWLGLRALPCHFLRVALTLIVHSRLVFQVEGNDFVHQGQRYGRKAGMEHLRRIALSIEEHDVNQPHPVSGDGCSRGCRSSRHPAKSSSLRSCNAERDYTGCRASRTTFC
jgi:hypothetical protein